jgi:hypothetical protein
VKLSVENNRALAVLFSVLTLSLSFNLYLGWRVQALNTALQVRRQIGVPVGTNLSSLPVLDAEGRPAKLSFTASMPTVIYVLSPTCGWCRKNEQNMRVLASRKGSDFRFIGLSPTQENLRQYISAGHAPFPVYVLEPAGFPQNLDLQTTPQTLLLSPFGVVQKTWLGAYDGSRKREIEAFFGVDLPGIESR